MTSRHDAGRWSGYKRPMTHQQSRRAAYGSRRPEYKSYGPGEPQHVNTPGGSGRPSGPASEGSGIPAQVPGGLPGEKGVA